MNANDFSTTETCFINCTAYSFGRLAIMSAMGSLYTEDLAYVHAAAFGALALGAAPEFCGGSIVLRFKSVGLWMLRRGSFDPDDNIKQALKDSSKRAVLGHSHGVGS